MVKAATKSLTVQTPRKPQRAPKQEQRIGRVAKLSRAASSLITPAMRARGFAEAEVVTKWARIVGIELARATVPIKLAFPRGQRVAAVLHVRAESAFAPILQQRENFIIELVNRYLGYGAVARIQVKHGPLNVAEPRMEKQKKLLPQEAQKNLDDIVGTGALSPLQLALRSLGEYVMSEDADKNK